MNDLSISRSELARYESADSRAAITAAQAVREEAAIARTWIATRPPGQDHIHISVVHANSEGYWDRTDMDIHTD
jgi:hypothetical protein